jgi:hypothetical protein
MLLPQFVGKEERDDYERQQEKRAKDQTLDHDKSPVQYQQKNRELERRTQ